MKLRVEITDGEEEIVIFCKEKNDAVTNMQSMIEKLICFSGRREMVLYSSDLEYYVPFDEILYFESSGGKVYAHTKTSVYTTTYKLFEIEEILPPNFVRIAKSTVANINLISSLKREIVGNGEIYFKDSVKKAYFSRGYFKILHNKIQEMRLGQ